MEYVNFDDALMPPDPFAGDPNDPASFLEPDDDGPAGPVSEEERLMLQEDLANIRRFRTLLEPRGVRGISMLCEDCDELHYYDWPIITANITTMLNGDTVPVHEPGADPDPDFYVSWEYCAGYADAVDWMNRGRRGHNPRFGH
ncbi:hypothetical protein Csp1_06840 [Corynebacterium provencense]|uniref:DUF5319 domain-containing protein n=1 Tax=Corynebacterium provencense TaxID=1737425 RepID=A0A2Z3YSE4_9CORY|nr:hypothetical protein Csp1_06840 [Corynebacterium provencense]